jgi:hypothetical protein
MCSVLQEAREMEAAFNKAGISMMSEDFAAKLLAYVSILCGRNEVLVTNKKLLAGIGIAQQKFNIRGGEVPDTNGINLIQQYTAELETYFEKAKDPFADDFWLKEILERYDLK